MGASLGLAVAMGDTEDLNSYEAAVLDRKVLTLNLMAMKLNGRGGGGGVLTLGT